jgi:Domain of unknown function (DUF4269)
MNFDNIGYLQHGNNRQRHAYAVLTNSKIFSKLKQFDPILVGTIPINIDIENSDLDIICSFANEQEFQKSITDNFSNEENFSIRELPNLNTFAIVANFFLDGFEIEIFGQTIPIRQQFAYRHMIVEHNLLNKYGEAFRQQIIELKRQGLKTEPAFGIALDLTGDPYKELLKFETEEISPNR